MVSDTGLNVRSAGEGEPTLLFVHGFGCSLGDWKAQIEALSPTFRCVALDLPGHGGSGMPDQVTMAAMARAVNSAKAQSGARHVVLIGHSLGVKVVREAYCQSDTDVIGLVFIEGALYEGDRESLVQRAKAAIDRAGFAAFAKAHFAAMFVEHSDPKLRDAILARVFQLDPDFGRSLYLEAVGWDPLRGQSTLRQMAVPVLCLQSTHVDSQFTRRPIEPGVKTSFMEAVETLVPQSEVKVIAGCGHFPQVEAADIVNQHLRDFAARVMRTQNEH